MPLRAFRRRINLWIQRPIGQLAGLLLLLAMVSAGVPTGQVHAHTGGDHDHDHFAQMAGDHASDEHDHATQADPDGSATLHAHDASMTVSALPPVPLMVLGVSELVAPAIRTPTPPPPLAARAPPYRPPIA